MGTMGRRYRDDWTLNNDDMEKNGHHEKTV